MLLALTFAVACTVAIAACGGASPNKSNKSGHRFSAFLAYSECMRSHGVTNFPDPVNAGGIQLPAGMNPAAPSFRAAQSACFHLMPGGGPARHPLSKQQIAAMVKTSECMRSHGVTGFPDPYSSPNGPPNLNPANYSSAEYAGGEVLAIPKSIDLSSPVFKEAAKACHFS